MKKAQRQAAYAAQIDRARRNLLALEMLLAVHEEAQRGEPDELLYHSDVIALNAALDKSIARIEERIEKAN